MSAKTKSHAAPVDVHAGSGNVFADLGLPKPVGRQHKAERATEINTLLGAVTVSKNRGLTQRNAAALFGIDPPKVSDLSRGKLSAFSIDRLLTFLTRLDQHVKIIMSPARKGRAVGLYVVAGS